MHVQTSREVCEFFGDVVLAVAQTSVQGPLVCAGENGTVYFVDPSRTDGHVLFE
jgi:hypothetical protein